LLLGSLGAYKSGQADLAAMLSQNEAAQVLL
jgi:hypothetical protein